MQYVILMFEDGPTHPTTGETPMEVFVRRFENYRGLREQIGTHRAVVAQLTPEEEADLNTKRREAGLA